MILELFHCRPGTGMTQTAVWIAYQIWKEGKREMWRPNDWNNPHSAYELDSLHSQIEDDRLRRAYEAGADAMFNTLNSYIKVLVEEYHIPKESLPWRVEL